MKKRLLSLILAGILPISMMFLTSCKDKELATPDKDTIGSWEMTTEQEDIFEKVAILLGAEGEFYQFNAKQSTLVLNAKHYKNGKLVDEGDFAQFVINGDGYLYIDYHDSDIVDITDEWLEEDEIDEKNIAAVSTTIMTNDGEDGTVLEFEVAGMGSADTMLSLLNTDDSWESGEKMEIPYEEEFDLWGINLSGGEDAGEMGETVSATKEAWMKGECLIITAKFTEQADLPGIDGETVSDDGEDVSEEIIEEYTQEQLDEIDEQLENAEEAR